MNAPNRKLTTYTQGTSEVLPTLDPVKQDVAKPFVSTDKLGNVAADYLGGDAASDFANKLMGGTNISSAIGDVKDKASSISSRVSQSFLSGGGITELSANIVDLVDVGTDGVGLDFDSIKTRLEDSLGVRGAMASITGSLKDDLVRIAGNLGGESIGLLTSEGMKLIEGGDIKDMKSVMDLIGRITNVGGIMDMFDFSAQACVINALANKLIGWGVPDLIDKVLDVIDNNDRKEVMYEELAIRAAALGSVESLKHYTDKISSGRQKAISDVVIHNIVSQFKRVADSPLSDKEYGNELLSICKQYDRLWDRDRYDENVVCLAIYSIASKDAQRCLAHTDARPHIIAGKYVSRQRVSTIIRESFPHLVI